MTNYRFLRFPNGCYRAFTMSYDGGLGTDLQLMEIMRRYGLKGTFNISSGFLPPEDRPLDVERTPMGRFTLRQIVEQYGDFEIASHGATHPYYAHLPTSAAVYDVVKDREKLERSLERIVRGHVYPNGSYTRETVEVLRATGFLYGRTAVCGKGSFDLPEDPLLYDPTAHHNDPGMDALIDRFFDAPKYYCGPRLFTLWGHSHEFMQNDNWERMEHIAKRVAHREDVWYAGLQEIFEYVWAYRSLVYSIDSNRIYNPTNTTVWISPDPTDRKIFSLAPGQTVFLETNH